MMRWLKDKKKDRRSNSVSYDDDGNEDDYGFEKERPRPASKSPSTRRQLPPTPATPEEKSPHIYEEIPDLACTAPTSPQTSPNGAADPHRRKNGAFGKKANSGGKGAELSVKVVDGSGRGHMSNRYSSDVTAVMSSGGGGGKKKKMADNDTRGHFTSASLDDHTRQTSPNPRRNGTPEVHCDVIIKDTHCEILLTRKPRADCGPSDCSTSSVSATVPHFGVNSSYGGSANQYPPNFSSIRNQPPDGSVGSQLRRLNNQPCPLDRRASVDVHSSSKVTSAFCLASSSSSATPVIGNPSVSSGGAQKSGLSSLSSSTSRLNSLGASSFSVLNFTEPYRQKNQHFQQSYSPHQRQLQHQQKSQPLYQCMNAPKSLESNGNDGSADSISSGAKGVETYTTASNFIARPVILPFNPLPGAKDPCVEAFGRPLSSSCSSNEGAYASIQDSAVGDSAYQTAPLKNDAPGSGANSVTYASIQDADGKTNGIFSPTRSHAPSSSALDKQQQQQQQQSLNSAAEKSQNLFYGENHNQNHKSVNIFQQDKALEKERTVAGSTRAGIIHVRTLSDSSSCTYASVSFPSEPKHYNTITDLGDRQVVPENYTKAGESGAMGMPSAHKAMRNNNGCYNDAGDDIYCGVAPYRINAAESSSRARCVDRENNPCVGEFSAQRQKQEMRGNGRPNAPQSIYADIVTEACSSSTEFFTTIGPGKMESSGQKSSSAIHLNTINPQGNPSGHDSHSFFSPHNDLHRFAVDRNSFRLEFCACSDDHASSGGFADLTSSKPCGITNDKNKNSDDSKFNNDMSPDCGLNTSPNDAEVNQTQYALSSCKDCGRLIKQITYSESYSDETYEHAYSSRLLTRKSRRYSSPDITFSEISNNDFAQDPASYLHYRSSPSWSRRSPGNDARISRDDTWASSPRSDDVIPPAYGSLDDNGFVSNHYERWSPTYDRNRSVDSLKILQESDKIQQFMTESAPSSTTKQKKNRPWISSSPLTADIFGDQNISDDMKERSSLPFSSETSSRFSTLSNETHAKGSGNQISVERLQADSLQVTLPAEREGLNTKIDSNSTPEPKRTNFLPLFGKAAKSKSDVKLGVPENHIIDSEIPRHRSILDDIESSDQIPDKNTKKLTRYFQNLSSRREGRESSANNVSMCQEAVDNQPGSAFTKPSSFSSPFCAAKIPGSLQEKSPATETRTYCDTEADLSHSPAEVTRSRSRHKRDQPIVTASLAAKAKMEAPLSEQESNKFSNFTNKNANDDTKIFVNDNTASGTGNVSTQNKAQNKTDSGDTCYEFDISTSSEGEQQSSYDNILSKVRISLNLEHEVQHIAESRAACRKRLLCRRCKKIGALIDEGSRDADDVRAHASENGLIEDGLGLLGEEGMCPHLSLKFGELRDILDNLFVDQRAAILDCLTDHAAAPNHYSFKTSHGLHADLSSLPAALQQLCRECGSEVLTSDSESITTVYSGLQPSRQNAQARLASPGSGAHTHTPSCDSDEGTMADNSGESGDDDDSNFSDNDDDKTKLKSITKRTQKKGQNCGGFNDDKAAAITKPGLAACTKSHKEKEEKTSISGSSNHGSTHSTNLDFEELNNSSGYDEPEASQKHHPLNQRLERTTHRTKKKEKRERKSSSAHRHNHGLACWCSSEGRSSRGTCSQAKAHGHASKSGKQCNDCPQKDVSAGKASETLYNTTGGAPQRKTGPKKSKIQMTCACSSPSCLKHGHPRHGHQHSLRSQMDKSSFLHGAVPADVQFDEMCDSALCEQGSPVTNRAAAVSEKALKEIYSPLPPKALCLLTSRHNNIDSSLNSNGIISSNSSNNSNSSNSSVAGDVKVETGERQETCYLFSPPSSSASIHPHSSTRQVHHCCKDMETSAEALVGTKDQNNQTFSTIRETDNKGRVEEEKRTNEAVEGKRARRGDNKREWEGEGKGKSSDNVIESRIEVNKVQTHLACEKRQDTKPQACTFAATVCNGACKCGGGCSSCLHVKDVVLSRNIPKDLCADLSTLAPACDNDTCTCEERIRQDYTHHQQQQHHHQQQQQHHHHHQKCSGLQQGDFCCCAHLPVLSTSSKGSVMSSSNNQVTENPAIPKAFPSLQHSESATGLPVQIESAVENYTKELKVKTAQDKGLEKIHGGSLSFQAIAQCAHNVNSISNVNTNREQSVGEDNNAINNDNSLKLSGKAVVDNEIVYKNDSESSSQARQTIDISTRSGQDQPIIDAFVLSADLNKGGAPHEAPVPSNKPHASGTTGATGLNCLPLSLTGAGGPQCEDEQFNTCLSPSRSNSSSSKIQEPATATHTQPETSRLPLSSFSLDQTTAISHCSSLNVSSPTGKTQKLIPRKHKLELATLDLLPETVLGSDMNEPESDPFVQTAPESAESAHVKSKSRARAGNVVQKMAKLFEENASTISKNKQVEDCNKIGQSISSNRVQRSSGEVIPAARVSSVNANKRDSKFEKVAISADETNASPSSRQAAPPSPPVSRVQSSHDVQAKQRSSETGTQHLTLSEKSLLASPALPKARARCKTLADTSTSLDCAEKKGENSGGTLETSPSERLGMSDVHLNPTIKEEHLNRILDKPSSKSTSQNPDCRSKDIHFETRVGDLKGLKENTGTERNDRKEQETMGIPHVPKARGSRLSHSDLLLRLKNATDSSVKSGFVEVHGNPEDSSSASSSPSSKKKTAISGAMPAAVDGSAQDGCEISSQHQQHSKQKRYSKKHKRRSKSRSARRRSGVRSGGQKEERTYYYFSSDLSDIDVVEVDDWETYATSLTSKATFQSRSNQSDTENKAMKKENTTTVRSGNDARTNSESPFKSRADNAPPFFIDHSSTSKTRHPADSRSSASRNSANTHRRIGAAGDTKDGKNKEENDAVGVVSGGDGELYSCIDPSAVDMSSSSSAQASPELRKSRRGGSGGGAGGGGGGKSSRLEVYKTKRNSSNNNSLLSEMIIRNYDMQIYGNV
ncbi:hypothetical protein PoB_005318700 [Plakobranchus ocellatus]|uniref:Uncharacterized protein n=1 Tax=Plakobranchus ocellatus TaxID=259542 RepID=A0AAV4C514_9GAST|nr:hypothetical protein PoB_005318700 [Plakobranchus ocellatus]